MLDGLLWLHAVGTADDELAEGRVFRTDGVGICLCRSGRCQAVVDDREYEIVEGGLGVFFPRSVVRIVSRSEDLDAVVIRVDTTSVQPMLNRTSDIGRVMRVREHPLCLLPPADFATAQMYVDLFLRLASHQERDGSMEASRLQQLRLLGEGLGMFVTEQMTRRQPEAASESASEEKGVQPAISGSLPSPADEETDSPATHSSGRASSHTRGNELASQFLSHLHRDFRSHHDVGYYAGLQCVSTRYFSVVVHERTGRTPSSWIAAFLLEEACYLLTSSSRSVQEVADDLGFPSQSYFGKWFKTRMGLAPTAWRRGQPLTVRQGAEQAASRNEGRNEP